MTDWKRIDYEKYGPISKIVATFIVGPPLQNLPIPSFKVKIIENQRGAFEGVPNIALKDEQGNPDWIGGFGNTPDEALEDTLKSFYALIDEANPKALSDLVWADEQDF